ncbi:hypothetical protein L1987_52338 [Smallanthus sonchifolius]|uniref:Uncharacterized protein n=1 Tax=Smallanthus sonchifolius TaxID=185202 RepID=A0ACB9ETF6_9ASTR|nr:hypothetical protein L1987_52338 [Smallanthus sonchifolius]
MKSRRRRHSRISLLFALANKIGAIIRRFMGMTRIRNIIEDDDDTFGQTIGYVAVASWDQIRVDCKTEKDNTSATMTALAVDVGFQDGVGGTTFATVLILACIVMYDASGV